MKILPLLMTILSLNLFGQKNYFGKTYSDLRNLTFCEITLYEPNRFVFNQSGCLLGLFNEGFFSIKNDSIEFNFYNPCDNQSSFQIANHQENLNELIVDFEEYIYARSIAFIDNKTKDTISFVSTLFNDRPYCIYLENYLSDSVLINVQIHNNLSFHFIVPYKSSTVKVALTNEEITAYDNGYCEKYSLKKLNSRKLFINYDECFEWRFYTNRKFRKTYMKKKNCL